jgi:hypothetical protein
MRQTFAICPKQQQKLLNGESPTGEGAGEGKVSVEPPDSRQAVQIHIIPSRAGRSVLDHSWFGGA